jgi:hypothetical protein
MTRGDEKAGLDLFAVVQNPGNGAMFFAGLGGPTTDQPVVAAENALTELKGRATLDTEEQVIAVAAALVAGRMGEARRRIDALSPKQRVVLDRVLGSLGGVGRAPKPRGAMLGKVQERSGGGSGYKASQLRAMLEQQWRAWRVVRAVDRKPYGSAAVVNGAWFAPHLAGRSLVLTCAHVCSNETPSPGEPEILPPSEAALDWISDEEVWEGSDGQPGLLRVKGKDPVWVSPVKGLDASLLEVEALPPRAHQPETEPTVEVTPGDGIYIWSYPGGGTLCSSIQDNAILSTANPYFCYETFAEGGSSGAPVFSEQTHELIGLHRSANAEGTIRQAVFFQVILERARAVLAP